MSPLEAAQAAHASGNYADAEKHLRSVLTTGDNAARVQAAVSLAQLLLGLGRGREGERVLTDALVTEPTTAALYDALGSILFAEKRFTEAAAAYSSAVAHQPAFAEAFYNLGNALRESGDATKAEQAFHQAAALRPELGEAYNNLGNLRYFAGDPAAAIPHYQRALAVRADLTAAWFNLGNALKATDRLTEALNAYLEVGRRNPRHAGAYNNAGEVLERLERFPEALHCYQTSASLAPDLFQPKRNVSSLMLRLGRLRDAIDAAETALAVQAASAECLALQLHASLHAGIWKDLDALIARLRPALAEGTAPPFMVATLPVSNAEQTLAAGRWAANFAVPAEAQLTRPPQSRPPAERLRIGYLSSDFHSHATAFLLAEVLELHDRARFTITAYSCGPDDGSPMRKRLVEACESFVDLRGLCDREAAVLIDEDQIDILVDLKGYTDQARTRILAYRPAPVQVNWLGYPGSMGADFIDYVIGDATIAPLAFQEDCVERIVRLPNCFQPNDRHRHRADVAPDRSECGLPVDAFVFCCFNNTYKIMPKVFSIWMRLLTEVPGSVLWLLEANPAVRSNLQAEAAARGVAPDRLVFAPRIAQDAHLARHAAADLFLDTLPVNALTTASDALWTGLPVLTCLGDTVAGRGCASLLNAVGLPELITADMQAYEALALALARDPGRLAALRDRLRTSGPRSPLFDTPRFTQDLERAYRIMQACAVAGEPPCAFSL